MTRTTPDTEIIAKAIRLACRAPSLHNSQPWRWVVGEAAVDLFADHERVVRSADRSGREAIISCGAALDHFRIAMAAAGWKTNVDPFPNPSDRDHLASLDFTPAHYVTTAERDRAERDTEPADRSAPIPCIQPLGVLRTRATPDC